MNFKVGDRVLMKDSHGRFSQGLLLMIRDNPIDPQDLRKDAIVLLDNPETFDPWGPADPMTDYWAPCLSSFEKLAGRALTSQDRIASPDIKETFPASEQDQIFLWIEEVL